jgi:HK97 family phage major capsid protein
MKTIEQLRNERAALIANARKIFDAAEKAGRDMTAEEDQQFTKMHDDADLLKKQIEDLERTQQAQAARVERQQQAEQDLAALNANGINLNNVAGSAAGNLPGGQGRQAAAGGFAGATLEDQALAISGWFMMHSTAGMPTNEHREAANRCGISLDSKELILDLNPRFDLVRNALKSNVPGEGGVLRLGEFIGPLEQAMLEYGPMMEVAQVIRTGHANPLPWPTANDTTNTGRQIGEAKSVNSNVDPDFAAMILGAYKFTSDEILVPFELTRDASVAGAINLAQIIAAMLGERIGRIKNTKFTTGSGAGTAYGIVPRSTLGKTAASATAIAADELFDLQHSVPRAYRKRAGFMANDNTWKAVRKLKDSQNRYLWEISLQAGMPDTLLKWPIRTNDDMADIATGQKTMLAGPFDFYKVREVGRIRIYRLTERHREDDQDAFLAFQEADGNLLNPGTGPVRHLIQA